MADLRMAAGASSADPPPGPIGEARWPAASAVLAAIGLTFLLPEGERVGPVWLLPAIEVVLLAAIVAGDPGRISRRSNLLRGLSIALVAVLVLGSLSSTLLLIDALVHGGPETNSADALLSAGTTVWLSTTSPSRCCTGSSTAAARPPAPIACRHTPASRSPSR
jgi:hypothetical protein